MNTQDSELKPCPFCGSEVELGTDDSGDYACHFQWKITCWTCSDTYMKGHLKLTQEHKSALIKRWNTRASP